MIIFKFFALGEYEKKEKGKQYITTADLSKQITDLQKQISELQEQLKK